jgi:hypothetical protein
MQLADYLVAISTAIIVASVVILSSFLSRYGKLVDEADKSTRLAKDVWDSMNSRFSIVDTRLIDLMAKTEVLASRSSVSHVGTPSPTFGPAAPRRDEVTEAVRQEPASANVMTSEGTETERRVLGLLVEGHRDSAQIRNAIGKSREHTARLMKSLFDRGLVVRNDRNKPYLYEITDKGRSYLAS